MLPNLSLVVETLEFRRNAYINFILEILSYEALVTRRVTVISNNLYDESNAADLYIMFKIIFTNWIWNSEFSQVFFW